MRDLTHCAAVYVITEKDGKVPVFLREKTSFMRGYHALASGGMEKGETPVEAAVREVYEEIGVRIDPADLVLVCTQYRRMNNGEDEVVDFFFRASRWEGEPVCGEPEKHGPVRWAPLNDLPQPFLPFILSALQSMAAGKIYSEYIDDQT